MSRASHFHLAVQLLTAVLHREAPADKQMEAFFRSHREMGARDRGVVAEAVYGCLRRRRSLAAAAGSDSAADLVAAYLLTAQGWSGRALSDAGYAGGHALAERVRTLDRGALPLPVRADLPDWLAEKLLALLGAEETLALAEALNAPAPVDLRVNTFKAKREDVQTQLASEGFETRPTPFSPVGLRRADRSPLFRTKAFADGLFEVQDEGSQLISLLVEAKRRESVVDFCAGAGGKTLHLGAAMANTGAVYALDNAEWRLEKIKPRLKRSGLQNVRTIAIRDEHDARVKRLAGKMDRVLVDAPCSGTGTLRRNPDIKWRPIDLAAITATQSSILEAASALVKPGGRLVYATCSVLREENEEVVERFMAAHPGFTPVPVNDIFARRDVSLRMDGPWLRLYPHRHNTDGFFTAVLERT
ncbi:MAG: RsmB/NOP family class I SAM-dependent RNA methyltransferase [Gammaproteobacteria bacterium]|nr:RsmB/NOP family class I SAM-dependent RNA methyltransferase [Gammaproteobacteria bacterium]